VGSGDETLDPKAGSCTLCPKRSSQQPMLFPEHDSGKSVKDDRCLDPACFDRKYVAFVQTCETKHREKHPNLRLVQIGYGTLSPAMQETYGERVERFYAPKLVKAGNANAIPALQVDGPKVGKLVYIDMGESSADNGAARSQRPRGADGKPVPLTLAERRARLQKRRCTFVVRHVHEFLRNLTPEQAVEIVSTWNQQRIDREAGENVFDPVALLTAFGSTKRADYVDDGEAWKEYDALRVADPLHEAAAALIAVAQVWIKRLNVQGSHTVIAQAADARRICEIIGLDFAAIEAEAVKAIPKPKSWSDLAEDGTPLNSETSPTPKSRNGRIVRRHRPMLTTNPVHQHRAMIEQWSTPIRKPIHQNRAKFGRRPTLMRKPLQSVRPTKHRKLVMARHSIRIQRSMGHRCRALKGKPIQVHRRMKHRRPTPKRLESTGRRHARRTPRRRAQTGRKVFNYGSYRATRGFPSQESRIKTRL
jgi:hypothetical protein